jgi:hypothetical protein
MDGQYFIPGTGISCNGYPASPYQLPRKAEIEEIPSINSMLVSPNPSIGVSKLSFESGEIGRAHYQVMDNLGRIVKDESVNVAFGTNTYSIDISNQPDGIYLLNLVFKDKKHQIKLLKNN